MWRTWVDVDLAANVLHVRPKEGWSPKTGDQRPVPLSPEAFQVLAGLPPSPRHPQPGRQ